MKYLKLLIWKIKTFFEMLFEEIDIE